MPSNPRTHQLNASLVYHVISRGNFRSEVFHEDKDYIYFIEILRNYSKEHRVLIYHWVLMPNHYHLLLELAEPQKLSKIMAGIARSYVHYYHKTYQTSGHLWQGRFKSQPIEKEKYLLSCGRYIERNPLKARLVEHLEEYPYSSARYYILNQEDTLTTKDPLMETFGKDPREQREGYRTFLRDFDAEVEKRFESLEDPLGSRKFMRTLVKVKGLFIPRRKGRPKELIKL